MVRDWQVRSGFTRDLKYGDAGFNLGFAKDYSKYKQYMSQEYPTYIKGTPEEIQHGLCGAYNLTPDGSENLRMSFVEIYLLIMEQQAFLSWHRMNKNKKQ